MEDVTTKKYRIISNIKKWRFDWKKIALMKRHRLNVDGSLKSLGCCVQVEFKFKRCFKKTKNLLENVPTVMSLLRKRTFKTMFKYHDASQIFARIPPESFCQKKQVFLKKSKFF